MPDEQYRANAEELSGTNSAIANHHESETTELGGDLNRAQADIRRTSTLIGRASEEEDITLGDFDLEAVLGEGTFGRVYLAHLPS